VSLRALTRRLEERFRAVTFARTMLPTVGALGLQLVAFAVTARALGVEQFGRYTAILAIAAVGVELTGLGSMDLLVRAVARDATRFSRYFGHMILSLAGTWPLTVLVGTVVASEVLHIELAAAWVGLAIGAEVLLGRLPASLEMIMVAHGDTVRAGWLRLGNVLMRLAAATLYFVLLGQHGLQGWILVLACVAVVVTLACHWMASRLYGRADLWFARQELGDGALLCLTQAAASMQSNMDRMVLTRFASASEVGAYGAAGRMLQLGLFPLQVATRITYPKFFRPERQGLALGRAFAIRLIPPMLAVGALSALCVAAAAWVIPVVLGPQYQASVEMSMWLALALPFIAVQTPPADALVAANLHSVRAMIYAASSLGFGFVLLLGARLMGPQGVVAAFIAGHAMLAAALWLAAFLARERMNPQPSSEAVSLEKTPS
jgi:O-antigen/teichoic acid export membrane protein